MSRFDDKVDEFTRYAHSQLLTKGAEGLKLAVHQAMAWAAKEGYDNAKKEKKK